MHLYEAPTQTPPPPPPTPSIPIVVFDNGVIQVSLRALTLASCVAITVALLLMLKGACEYDEPPLFDCNARIPMISSVICLPTYDRITCLLFMFFSYSVQQQNLRANYKKLHGIISQETNDFLFWTGIVSVVSLPAITFFDEHILMAIHGVIAVIIFTSIGLYAYVYTDATMKNRAKFSPEMQQEIDLAARVANWLLYSLVGLALSAAIMGTGYYLTPILEWCTTLLFLNYFGLLSFGNEYYSTLVVPKDQ